MSQLGDKTSKLSRHQKQLVNFTQASFKKYDSVKIVQLVTTLDGHNLAPDVFAREVQSYFVYHAERKNSVLELLREQVLAQKQM